MSRPPTAVAGVVVALLLAGCGAGGPSGDGAAPPEQRRPLATATVTVPTTTSATDPPALVAPVDARIARPTPWGTYLPQGGVAMPVERVVPVRLRVPALGVDAPVATSGVAADGALGLPADPSSIAWFEGGPVPGDSGSAVLAAHVDWNGQAGVFFDLAELAGGEAVEVVLSDGTARRFVTGGAAQFYDKAALPVTDLFRRGEAPQLTLVTCGGRFDPVARSYERNVVVVANPVT